MSASTSSDDVAADRASKEKQSTDQLLDEAELPKTGCGIMAKYPVLTVILFALAGIGIGVGLSFWEPEDSKKKSVALKWLGLLGDLFIRALKAVVLPLVFINVTISIVDMMSIGRASSIGWLTIGTYLTTTVIAAILGILSTLAFMGLYTSGTLTESVPAQVALGCTAAGELVTELADGTLQCTASDGSSESTMFYIEDLTGSFATNDSGARDDISLSDTFYDGIFTKIVSSNIFADFVDANFAAVVAFAVAFGAAMSKVMFRSNPDANVGDSNIMMFFKELDAVFLTLINWIIIITPFAVFSLIIKAVGNQTDLAGAFSNVGYLVLATMVAMGLQFLVVYMLGLGLIRKENPFRYLSHMVPAQTMAFACASSAATIPMTLRCVQSTGEVPDPVARFVIPLGATVNMDGGAIYFPCACIWLAVWNGITPSPASYVLLVIIATVGSAGTAPVPSASLVLIITAYNTVFNTTGTPDGFEFILAIDWFMDRLRTTLNVTGDTVVAGIVAHLSRYENAAAKGVEDEDVKVNLEAGDFAPEGPKEVVA